MRTWIAYLCLSLACLGALSHFAPNGPRKWSDPHAWDGTVPVAGGDVVILKGRTVILDVSPPRLGHLQIDGTLLFADRDVSLQAEDIDVTGRLQIGSEKAPFQHMATITLGGSSSKCLGVTGVLELHGASRGVSWTRLTQTAQAGASLIFLDAATQWRTGDSIVLASTDFDPAHAETATVASVTGQAVTLTGPLKYEHWGRIVSGVDERAEVGLLTRSVVIQGDAASARGGAGGQVMVMRGGAAHLEGAELTRMGQKGRMGRYPLHFHLAGDQRGSYVRECSLHGCYNRCLTLHGTRGVRVSSNVAYDTIGHCYFLEDGVETGNVLDHNLGILTRRARPGEAVLPSDLTPATFWVTNPDNVLRGNVAAGSQGNGFWYSLPLRPTGLSQNVPGADRVHPRRTRLGGFQDNVAHSNDNDGLFVDNGPNPAGVTQAPNYEPPALATFEGLTAYKNRRRGVWLRGSRMEVVHARLADNAIGATFAASETTLRDSLVVGETANEGQNGRDSPKPSEPHFSVCGFEFYDGLVSARNVTFVNFAPSPLRHASALSYVRFTPFFVDPRNYVEGLRFVNAVPVHFDAMPHPSRYSLGGDGYRSAVFCDRDGCVTGQAGAMVSVANPFLKGDGTEARPAWNASVSRAAYGRLFIDDRDTDPNAPGPVTITRQDGARASQRTWGSPADGGRPNTDFQTNVAVDRHYTVAFAGPSPTRLRLTLRFRRPGDWVQLSVPWQGRTRVVTLKVPAGSQNGTASVELRPDPPLSPTARRLPHGPGRGTGAG